MLSENIKMEQMCCLYQLQRIKVIVDHTMIKTITLTNYKLSFNAFSVKKLQ